MIRLAMIYLGFLALAAGVIFFRPGAGPELAVEARAEVQRQSTQRITTTQVRTTTAPQAIDAQVEETNSVLASLGKRPVKRPERVVETAEVSAEGSAQMRELTSGILVSLGAKTDGLAAPTRSGGEIDLDGVLAQAPDGVLTTRNERGTLTVSLVQRTNSQPAARVESQTTPRAVPTAVRKTIKVPTLKKLARDETYVVKPGDNLASISIRFYGDKSGYKRIFEANKDKLKTPQMIKVGQKLKIPAS